MNYRLAELAKCYKETGPVADCIKVQREAFGKQIATLKDDIKKHPTAEFGAIWDKAQAGMVAAALDKLKVKAGA